MPVSLVQSTKHALVSLLKSLPIKFNSVLNLSCGSDDAEVRTSYKKVSRRVHPDRGGSADDQKKLNFAYGNWEKAAREAKSHRGKSAVSVELGHANTERASRSLAAYNVP